MSLNTESETPAATVTEQSQSQNQTQPTVTTQSAGTPLTLEQIQLSALCNWCRNPLVMSDNFDETNFVDIGRPWHQGDTSNAQAVFCETCINDTFRTGQPKAIIDRVTLDEIDVAELPPLS